MYLAAHESLLDFGARFYDPATAIFLQQDPLAEKYYNISPYAYCANNPVNFVDPDGKALETAWDAICIVYDVGAAVYSHIKGDHIRARGYWTDAGWDTMAALVPFLPAGLSKVGRLDDAVEFTRDLSKTNKSADELGDVSKVKVKNPFGSKGKCDHQAKVEELKSLAEKEIKPNEQVLTEKKIHVEGSNRRPDVQILDENNKTRKVFEAERYPNRQRNKSREEEYQRLNVEYETHSLK